MHASSAPYVIVGAAGMLGRAWRELLDSRQLAYIALDRAQLDVTDAGSIAAAISSGAGVVVNCAAYTAVDQAEADEAAATRINGDAVGLLADHCSAIGAMLVHYSTDYVFNGRASTPYATDQPHDPVNAYGRSKAAGERALFASQARWMLVRTSWVYAPWGANFVRTMVKLTGEKPELKVVNDQRGRPTSAQHLAAATLKLLHHEQSGVFHVTDGGECTWYEFAAEIARLAGHEQCRISPCSSDEFPRPAKRPAYSVLDLSRAEAVLGPTPSWCDNLTRVMRQL
jgi:dTDP-4-dehydrorhamnose reductase